MSGFLVIYDLRLKLIVVIKNLSQYFTKILKIHSCYYVLNFKTGSLSGK